MKCRIHKIYYALLILILFVIQRNISTKLTKPTKKGGDEDLISDKELDALLKDPKYAAMAGDLIQTSDSKPVEGNKPKSHYMSASYKQHLERAKKDKASESPAGALGDVDLLSKSLTDPLKDLEILTTQVKQNDSKKVKNEEKEEKFKNFDFISKSQARYLIEVLKQPVFLNMLPQEAQQIVKVIYNIKIYFITKFVFLFWEI